ncbi:hypothetical protein ACFOD4_03620 [Pseudoroseomonas globiformis]|uniref:RHS repeat protein n=1 Tax=Teichococcus globiformis TaxID=2307229 RepID=A0ABV7G1G0_9PROT
MSYQRVLYDIWNVHSWQSQTLTYDDRGLLEQRDILYDDGSLARKQYDAANLSPIQFTTVWFDPDGVTLRGETRYDDGRRDAYQLDAGDHHGWDRVDRSYDAQGALLSKTVLYDDGRSVASSYTEGGFLYSRTTQGTADGIYKVESFSEDGSHSVLRYGIPNGPTMESRSYNADNQLTELYRQYGLDGVRTHYDAGDHLAWNKISTTESYRNDGLTTTTLNFDEGGRLVTEWNRPGWGAPPEFDLHSVTVRVSDDSNALAWRFSVAEDQTVSEVLGDRAWAVESDAVGRVTERSTELGNGVLLTVQYDAAQTEAWAAMATLTDIVRGVDFYVGAYSDLGRLEMLLAPSQADWQV